MEREKISVTQPLAGGCLCLFDYDYKLQPLWIVLLIFTVSAKQREREAENMGQRMAKLSLQLHLMKVIHGFETKTNVFSSCLRLM